jgi:AcrR family transcriptional regulator
MTSGKPTRADSRRSRERLLAAAAEVFAEQGTSAALDDIAKRAGTGNATLYRHFPTRQDLVQAVLATRYDDLRATAGRLLGDPDPLAALTCWLRRYIAHLTAYRGIGLSVLNILRDPETALNASVQEMIAAAAILIARAQHAAVIRSDLTVNELLALTSGMVMVAELNEDTAERRADAATRLLSLAMEGLLL